MKQRILAAFLALLDWPPMLSVVEWCQAALSLTSIQTDVPGRYSAAMTPYVTEPLNSFADPYVETLVLCWGAQTSKTMTLMAGVCWWLRNQPSPTMWVMPNKDLAQSFSENRLQPFMQSCAELWATRTTDRHRWKKTEMAFQSAVLNLIGSNSPANLASRPARLLVMDETDKFPHATGTEAGALELAELRTRTFASPKVVKTSTPSTPDGAIWQAFLDGDQRRFFVPCPVCGKDVILCLNPDKSALPRLGCEAKLTWDPGAKGPDGWDYRVVDLSAHFVCPHCQGRIEERQKTAMLRAGRWQPTNSQAATGVRSYHLPAFYAPWRKTTWGRLAVDFLRAQESVEGLRGYICGTLAEPDMAQWEGGASARRSERIVTAADPLTKAVRIITCDVQRDHLWFVCREWAPGGVSRLVEWGRLGTLDDLRLTQQRLEVAPDLCGVDSGFEATAVYRDCARWGWFAVRGDARESWPHHGRRGTMVLRPYVVRQFDPLLGTSAQGATRISELRWSNPSVKDVLARLRDGGRSPVAWEVPERWASEDYFRHLDGEYKTRRFNARTGRASWEWVRRSRHWPNHLLDCEAMQVAVALYLRILPLLADSDAETDATPDERAPAT
jgi:hypothetical protein